ncbi:TonB-dependent receptor plug domain-containing protein [Flavobacterium rhizosphaerae]|uniref:TonB-dependent receptor n=1 Tax=Flavobacterium rhizosphaerae TaxID=3163298 RepID=A0ABW8YUC4_9FLAO
MTFKTLLPVVLLMLCQFALAQTDTIVQLQEVILSDTQLHDFSTSQNTITLNDSVISKAPGALTTLLEYNSPVYFKQNGLGMVSSPSFRGTAAQQTAVVWNGININSQLNGQTDFNTLNAANFNDISIRAGGGSVIYGSSAIGGSIHLTDDLVFGKDAFLNQVNTFYGSYNTLNASYKLKTTSDNWSALLAISRNSSDNDYEYPGYNMKNTNGQYYNTGVNAAIGYKLNKNNILRLYSYFYDGNRHFSGTIAAGSKSMYDDINTRTLVEWSGYYNKFTSRLKLAYLDEHYKYYENFAHDNYTYGRVKTFVGRYDALYSLTNQISINAIADYRLNKGEGSDIEKQDRNIGSGALLFKHQMEKLSYELGIRQEVSDAYQSPLLFSAGLHLPLTNWYALKINGSKNYRMPTFNDLYWQGSGNPNLRAESSLQAEVSNVFTVGPAKLTLTAYYIKIKDMLRWIPGNGNIWRPENTGRVNSRGAEALLDVKKQWGDHILSINGTYAYTVSTKDGSTEQLIYVPQNKASAAIAYRYKKVLLYYRHLFTGQVFVTSSNSTALNAYTVSSLGAEYTIGFLKGLSAGGQVNNLFDTKYMAVATRPMPGRNYAVYINFKF